MRWSEILNFFIPFMGFKYLNCDAEGQPLDSVVLDDPSEPFETEYFLIEWLGFGITFWVNPDKVRRKK